VYAVYKANYDSFHFLLKLSLWMIMTR